MTSSLKTAVLFAALTALFVALGGMIGGKTGLIIALIFAVITNFASYYYSDKIVLSIYKARELQRHDAPQIYAMVEELSHNANIPMPKVYIVPDQSPNAFATGRNPENAVVAVTEGIVRLLSPRELRGVIAHEIAHIANRDILIQSVAAMLGAAITALANMFYFTSLFGGNSDEEGSSNPIGGFLMVLLAPIAASLIQMSISRSREYIADESGASYCNDPDALARALEKLSRGTAEVPMDANPATENMFIVTPFSSGNLGQLFSTHPPIEERVHRLRNMAQYK